MKSRTIQVCVFLSLICGLNAFSISSAEVQGDGKEETRPAKEGTSVTMRCTLALSNSEEWSVCQWHHIIEGQFDQTNKEMNVQCVGLPISQGQTCTNHGGSSEMDSYASRIKLDVSPTHCGLIITNSDARDNGEWVCKVSVGDNSQMGSLDLFMTNQSKAIITDPNSLAVPPEMIKYDLDASRPEIKSTCRGYGGRPEPTFVWYVNEDRYLINKNDYVANPIRRGSDPIFGAYVEETMTFTPTYDKICQDYGLSSVCKTDVFTFKLICKVDQGSYYQSQNADSPSEILVEVRNGAKFITSSIFLLLASCLLTSKF